MAKILQKIITFFWGECALWGHQWKRQPDGWQLNQEWEPEIHGFNNPQFPMTKRWVYWKCKKCGWIGEEE